MSEIVNTLNKSPKTIGVIILIASPIIIFTLNKADKILNDVMNNGYAIRVGIFELKKNT